MLGLGGSVYVWFFLDNIRLNKDCLILETSPIVCHLFEIVVYFDMKAKSWSMFSLSRSIPFNTTSTMKCFPLLKTINLSLVSQKEWKQFLKMRGWRRRSSLPWNLDPPWQCQPKLVKYRDMKYIWAGKCYSFFCLILLWNLEWPTWSSMNQLQKTKGT